MHHIYICVHETQSLFSNTHAQTQRSNRYFRTHTHTHTHITSKAIQSLSGIDSISGWVCEANTYTWTLHFFNIVAGHAPIMLLSQTMHVLYTCTHSNYSAVHDISMQISEQLNCSCKLVPYCFGLFDRNFDLCLTQFFLSLWPHTDKHMLFYIWQSRLRSLDLLPHLLG